MTVGVTGASGHIGMGICLELIRRRYPVVALAHAETACLETLPLKTVQGNIIHRDSLRPFFESCDVVIHAAGKIDLRYKRDKSLYAINVAGTENVLSLSKEYNIKKIIHLSSIEVFNPSPSDQPLDENRDLINDSPIFYSMTKREGHLMALEAAGSGMNVVVLCPTSVVGMPDHRPSKIGNAVKNIYHGKIPAAIRGGFDFIDLRDMANAAVNAIDNARAGEVYILSGQYHSVQELCATVLRAKGVSKNIPVLPLWTARLGLPFVRAYAALTKTKPLYDRAYLKILQTGNHLIDSSKARTELGLSKSDFGRTIGNLILWFQETGKL